MCLFRKIVKKEGQQNSITRMQEPIKKDLAHFEMALEHNKGGRIMAIDEKLLQTKLG